MTFHRLIFLLLLLTQAARAYSQGEEPLFHRLSLEQGLSDGRVNDIVQDRYGFMWFGTANGLNRYDGYSMRLYEEGASGLRSNVIGCLFRSRAGVLYVGDGKGLLQYDHAVDRFRIPPGLDTSVLTRKGYEVTLMSEDSRGHLYIGCTEGLFRYTLASGRIENMNDVLGTRNQIRYVSGLTFGRDGRLWITTQKQGFFLVDPGEDTYRIVPHDSSYGENKCCYAIHRTVFIDDDHLLVGQHSYGLTILDTRTLKFEHLNSFAARNDTIRFNATYRLIRDHKGRFWGGTAYFGLIQYNPETKTVVQYRNDPFNPNSYGGFRVRSIYEDREHNIWVGTGGYGVYRFNPDNAPVRYYPWAAIGNRTPPGPEVMSAAPRDSNSIWIGTDRGPAVFRFREGTFEPYHYHNAYHPELPGTNIDLIYPDRAGYIWMASRNLGISRYDPRRDKFLRFVNLAKEDERMWKSYPVRSPDLPANLVSAIAEDPAGNMLFLIARRIARIDRKTLLYANYANDSTTRLLQLKDVTDLANLGNDLLLCTESKGVTRLQLYTFRDSSLRTLVQFDSADRVSLRKIRMMPDGRIALATNKGIYLVPRQGGAIRNYMWPGGGSKARIGGMITSLPGTIWVCSERNVGRLDLQTGEWFWLGSDEGLKPTRFFGEAFRLLPDGRILAGCGDGLFLISPEVIRDRPAYTPVLVDFRVYGTSLRLPQPLQETKEIRLTHDQSFFSFAMSTLRFGQTGSTEYSYKLEGFDRDWHLSGADRSGQYTGVPGGKYTLLLRARTGSSAWVQAPQRITIVVGKAWWETWGFRIGLALLLLGMIGSIYLFRIRNIRRAARLRSEYEIRLNELEMSALRTQMNPHFIFNCLNTINSYINSNQKAQANHYITRFAKLIRLILENSRQRRVSLGKELEALHLYLQLESLRFENRFDYEIRTDDALDADNIEVPPLVLQPFVENAILHGILPRPGKGNILVAISGKGDTVEYVVEDDGIGRAEAKKRSAEGALQKESHGMAITEKRIALFNREHGAGAAVRIEDLEENGVAKGTRVIIPLALVEGF